MRSVRCIGVDWSGAAGPRQRQTIVLAEVRDRSLVRAPENGRTRDEIGDWLIEQAAGAYEFHYYPTDRDTAFSLGRAFVGQQVVKMLHLNISSLRRNDG